MENPQRQLKTLSRSKDSDFTSYLDGTFSETEIAIPVRSLNVGTLSEEVTFSIVPEESVERPAALVIARALVRPSTWIFSAGPMLVVWAKTASIGVATNWFLTLTTLAGVFAFHAAVNLFNDYGDHMKGQDRVRPHGGSRAIQKGWIRAARVRQIALGLTGLAILLGIPVVVTSPVVIIAGLALLVALEFAFQRIRLKARGLSEIVAFALTGPLLTVGFAWATVGRFAWSDVSLGCIFGSIALMYFHLANFENIMPDAQAGARTWATRAGFDASKTFFYFTAALTFFVTVAHVAYFERDLRLSLVVLVQLMALMPVATRVRALKSPLSSEIAGLRWSAVRLAWLSALALGGGYLLVMTSAV